MSATSPLNRHPACPAGDEALLLGLDPPLTPRPRGINHLSAPNPPLADDTIRLEPLAQAHARDFAEIVKDPEIKRYTRVPSGADGAFVREWLGRYESGWLDGSRAGFCIRSARDDDFYGFAAIVQLDLAGNEGEIGYMVAPAARGHGISARAVELLTGWGFAELGLERLELRIDVINVASVRIAERVGYRLDGVLRNVHFKEGLRCDTGVWSRLRSDELPSTAV